MIILIALLVLIAIMATPLLYAWKHRNDTSVVEPEESEWYDENGNHIYYDRKLIRYLEQKARKTDPQPYERTEKNKLIDEIHGNDETDNQLYFDRKNILKQQKENAGKSPRV